MKKNAYGNMWRNLVCILLSCLVLISAYGTARSISAQGSGKMLRVPFIGVSSLPDPSALPKGEGLVTYRYGVKNLIREFALTHIQVVDTNCNSVIFAGGDDDHDAELDYGETWRYDCVAQLSRTTENMTTATGMYDNIIATNTAYATATVGTIAETGTAMVPLQKIAPAIAEMFFASLKNLYASPANGLIAAFSVAVVFSLLYKSIRLPRQPRAK